MKNVVIAVAIFALLLLAGCKHAPAFNGDRSFEHITKLTALGARVPGSDAHTKAIDYIKSYLEECGATVELQEFKAEGSPAYKGERMGTNIVAHFLPKREKRILLVAHYDCRPWADNEDAAKPENQGKYRVDPTQPVLGANDGASGNAVLLEIAKEISRKVPPTYGVDMLFTDLEDSGNYGSDDTWCMGAKNYVREFKGRKPEKTIVVDMVGDADQQILMDRNSHDRNPTLTFEIWHAAHEVGAKTFVAKINDPIYDDHSPFVNAGYNAALIIDFDYKPYWHTLDDTAEHCSAKSLYNVGQTVLEVVYAD